MDVPDLDIDLLRTFEAICDTRSFTAAAERVGRTQSAVSLQVKRIEDELGRPIFERGRGAVELTPHGVLFAGYARRIVSAYDDALAAFDRKSVEGTVALGLPSDYAPRILPMVLSSFLGLYPKARVDIIIEESKVLVRRLAEGSVDLAFVTVGQGPTRSDAPVFTEEMVWVASASDDEIHLRDPLPLAIWGDDDTYSQWMRKALDDAGRAWRVVVTSPNLTGIKAAVELGLAITLFNRSSMTGAMRVLRPEDGFRAHDSLEVKLERGHLKSSVVLDRLEQHLRNGFASESR